jgi:hypothetical protein
MQTHDCPGKQTDLDTVATNKDAKVLGRLPNSSWQPGNCYQLSYQQNCPENLVTLLVT